MGFLLLTEGGKKIGFGHITRCKALSQALNKLKPGAEMQFVIQGNGYSGEFLKSSNVSVFNWCEHKGTTLELVKNSDVTVIDSYLAEKSLYDVLSKAASGRLLMIDDYNRIEYPRGVVVNPSVGRDELDYPKKEGTRYLLGKDYIILREEFWDIPEKKINTKIKRVLVTFGGSEYGKDLQGKVVKLLESQFGFKVDVVDTGKKRIDAGLMLELMLNADLCISGGGQTLYELARVGVPTIAVCFAENQEFNLKGLKENNFIENAGWHKNSNLLLRISESINILESHEERQRRKKRGNTLVDGKGAERIIKRSKLWE
ncbi:MAG: glycosyltransferase [Candidatus Auribacterota bacterium]|nr:glycosyltransferase [Candidatus Auribacterota bacterium]